MADGGVTSQLLQQKLQRASQVSERDRPARPKPRLNLTTAASPMRQVGGVGGDEALRPAAAEYARWLPPCDGGLLDPKIPQEMLSPVQGCKAAKAADASFNDPETSRSTRQTGAGGHMKHRISDTGSLHILGEDDNLVLISVKDEVNVRGAEGKSSRVKDKDKPKKYLHITDHKRNNQKRIEYKDLDIPSDMNGVLGQGTQGVVKKVYHRPSETYFAMKVLSTEGADSRQLVAELEHLLASVQQKHCKHLVTSYEAFFRSTKLCILMELMEYGSLADVLKKTRLEECEARVLSYHVLQGLKVLQDWGVVHRDIKPGNLLLNHKGIVKIGDFGVATFTNSLNLANSAQGTRIYMAPERMDLKQYSYQADIWSFGLCLAQFACGDRLQWLNNAADSDDRMACSPLQRGPHAFSKGRFFDCAVAIANKCFQVVFPETLNLSAALQDFVHSCLLQEWEQRPLAGQLLHHAFLAPLREAGQDPDGCTLALTLLRRIETLKAAHLAPQSSPLMYDSSSASSPPTLPSNPQRDEGR